MCSRNRPKFNTGSGLTPNSWGPAGERPGSAPHGSETGPPRVSRRALREFFAPGTAATATLGRPGRAAAGVAVELAAAETADIVETETSTRPGTAAGGPDIEADAQPAERGRRRIGRQVDIQVDVARANPFTPPPDGPAGHWR